MCIRDRRRVHGDLLKNQKMESEEEKKLGIQRIFLQWQKEQCWQKAMPISGRDPDRWRFDAVGNPVLNALRGCPCLLYTSPSPRDQRGTRMPSSA
eukprot:TRINITY_DN10106_c0_g1_i1.p3 TRINITY_DN10106_c0_g1~~TRINITY_DN10106_c0_g1_i1.p3  ORF type:complete len:104 (+),score=51.50 TRINITY_DN10106_c0_g1_i1:30-314(+)